MRGRGILLGAVLLVGLEAGAQAVMPVSQRSFSISSEGRDLVVENNELRLLKETALSQLEPKRDLTISTFLGQSTLANQVVNMGATQTRYDFDHLLMLGVNVKKAVNDRYFGVGTQIEYQTFENKEAALHLIPVTAFVFGRTPEIGYLRAVAEVGYSWAYVRQVGTIGRTGGLGGRAFFWQAGLEVPFHLRSDEEWALGVFYAERRFPEGDFDLSGDAVKLQGSMSL